MRPYASSTGPDLVMTPLPMVNATVSFFLALLLFSSGAHALGSRGAIPTVARTVDRNQVAAAAARNLPKTPALPGAEAAAGTNPATSAPAMPSMPSGGMPGSEQAPSYNGGPFSPRAPGEDTDVAPIEKSEQGRQRNSWWNKVEDHLGIGSAAGIRSAPGGPAVSAPFNAAFAACTKDAPGGSCTFQNWGIWGDAAHRARPSCHNNGTAIDVGPISCGGQTFKADSPQFKKIAVCLAQQAGEKFQVILNHLPRGHNIMNAPGHTGHMHVQLKGCKMVTGGGR